MFGRAVIPAISTDTHLPSPGGGPSEIVRISHATSARPGYVLGPIVMTFSALAYSDTQPSWTYGGGDLWLYDWVDHFDLLRISATTGQVLQRLVVPKIQSPLLAFNDDGLWIAPSPRLSSGPLYRLTPGATQLTPVFNLGPGGFAWWLIASGDSVWIGDQPRPVTTRGTTWELRGPDAVQVWHHLLSGPLATVTNQVAFDSPSMVVGNGSDGLWTVVVAPPGDQQQVVRIDPRTGRSAVVALLPAYPPWTSDPALIQAGWQAATFDGSLFLLDPGTQALDISEMDLSGLLYRVTPSGL